MLELPNKLPAMLEELDPLVTMLLALPDMSRGLDESVPVSTLVPGELTSDGGVETGAAVGVFVPLRYDAVMATAFAAAIALADFKCFRCCK